MRAKSQTGLTRFQVSLSGKTLPISEPAFQQVDILPSEKILTKKSYRETFPSFGAAKSSRM